LRISAKRNSSEKDLPGNFPPARPCIAQCLEAALNAHIEAQHIEANDNNNDVRPSGSLIAVQRSRLGVVPITERKNKRGQSARCSCNEKAGQPEGCSYSSKGQSNTPLRSRCLPVEYIPLRGIRMSERRETSGAAGKDAPREHTVRASTRAKGGPATQHRSAI